MMPHYIVRRDSDPCGVEHSPAVADYLRAVFMLSARGEATTTSAVAAHLAVAAPSMSAMVKRLVARDLPGRIPGHQITLTEHGRRHALDVVRRHRLVEEFLVRALDVPRHEADAEADALAHAVSQRLIRRIDAYLGSPTGCVRGQRS